MSLELVSFKLCPYVQRSLITLLHKDVEHSITYIELSNPPAWFHKISPLGKVPLLKVDGEVLFESAVINEYIDETTPERLMPQDALTRAKHRGWIEFGSELLGNQWRCMTFAAGEKYDTARADLRSKLTTLESQLGDGPYFAGNQLSLIDTAYAPFFMRLAQLNPHLELVADGEFPHCERWGESLLALPEVQNSVVDDFAELYRDYIIAAGGYAASRMA
jgi:glutathione S-transferase